MTPPQLSAYDLDLDTGTFAFYFSESVNASSFNPTQLTLQQYVLGGDTYTSYTLMNYPSTPLVTDVSSTVIIFTLTVEDLNNIKSQVNLATTPGVTYLSITSNFLSDQLTTIISVNTSDSEARCAAGYNPDTSCPYLQAFELDLNMGLLLLTYYEPINSSTLDPTQITIQSDNTMPPSENYTLTGGYFDRTIYSQVIILNLTNYDLNRLTVNTVLATATTNTYAILTETSVLDTNNNPYCNDTIPCIAANVTPDTIHPQLSSYSLDIDSGVLRLTFTEVVVLPLDLTAITFLAESDLSSIVDVFSGVMRSVVTSNVSSGMNGSGMGTSGSGMGMSGSGSGIGVVEQVVEYTLTGGVSTIDYTSDPHIVMVTITDSDLNEIKHRPEIAVSPDTSLLSLTSSLTTDHNNNSVVEITRFMPLMAANYTADTSPPEVTSFQLDMNSLILTFSFTEVVNVSSFDETAIILQGRRSITCGESCTLQNSSAGFKPLSLTQVEVYLSPEDANAIMNLTSLATSSRDTYLSLTSSLVEDTFGLSVEPIRNTTALPLSSPSAYTIDTSPPILTAFSFNLSSEILTLSFDEVISANLVILERIRFQSDISGSNPISIHGWRCIEC